MEVGGEIGDATAHLFNDSKFSNIYTALDIEEIARTKKANLREELSLQHHTHLLSHQQRTLTRAHCHEITEIRSRLKDIHARSPNFVVPRSRHGSRGGGEFVGNPISRGLVAGRGAKGEHGGDRFHKGGHGTERFVKTPNQFDKSVNGYNQHAKIRNGTDHLSKSANGYNPHSRTDQLSKPANGYCPHSKVRNGTDHLSKSANGYNAHSKVGNGTDQLSKTPNQLTKSPNGYNPHSKVGNGTDQLSKSMQGTDRPSKGVHGANQLPKLVHETDRFSKEADGKSDVNTVLKLFDSRHKHRHGMTELQQNNPNVRFMQSSSSLNNLEKKLTRSPDKANSAENTSRSISLPNLSEPRHIETQRQRAKPSSSVKLPPLVNHPRPQRSRLELHKPLSFEKDLIKPSTRGYIRRASYLAKSLGELYHKRQMVEKEKEKKLLEQSRPPQHSMTAFALYLH